ncbi:hypothetical protein RDI58_003837 [Solanum bulbocastanum]|uniref:Uncharacterized protein n=1 Tax=Solanum bulbocastanum TaxID=147425 RepID=A0AAN8YL61_SOLBU
MRGRTEATAGGRHGRPVGLVGVLRGRLMACMACPCYAGWATTKNTPTTACGGGTVCR